MVNFRRDKRQDEDEVNSLLVQKHWPRVEARVIIIVMDDLVSPQERYYESYLLIYLSRIMICNTLLLKHSSFHKNIRHIDRKVRRDYNQICVVLFEINKDLSVSKVWEG